jgi:DNA invertase Pin-like site-specific DNA recombinase
MLGNELFENLDCGIYLRVSTADQIEKHGIGLQKTKCKAMATLKGWNIVNYYIDEGVSGTIHEEDRPGFSKLLEDVENGKIKGLIIYALDRLGRRTQIVLRCIEYFSEKGIKVVSCHENFDTSTPTGNFMLTIFAALTQLERDTIVGRMKAGTEERKKRDGDIGGSVPLGYERTEDSLILNPEKAKLVWKIFSKRYIERWTINEIVDYLNKQRIQTSTDRTTKWSYPTIQTFLQNEIKYLGCFRNESSFRWPRILTLDFYLREVRANKAFDEYNRTQLKYNDTPKTQKSMRAVKRSKIAMNEIKAHWDELIDDDDSILELYPTFKDFETYEKNKKVYKLTDEQKLETMPRTQIFMSIPSPKKKRRT